MGENKLKDTRFTQYLGLWVHGGILTGGLVRSGRNYSLLKVQQVLTCVKSHMKETSFTCSLVIN